MLFYGWKLIIVFNHYITKFDGHTDIVEAAM